MSSLSNHYGQDGRGDEAGSAEKLLLTDLRRHFGAIVHILIREHVEIEPRENGERSPTGALNTALLLNSFIDDLGKAIGSISDYFYEAGRVEKDTTFEDFSDMVSAMKALKATPEQVAAIKRGSLVLSPTALSVTNPQSLSSFGKYLKQLGSAHNRRRTLARPSVPQVDTSKQRGKNEVLQLAMQNADLSLRIQEIESQYQVVQEAHQSLLSENESLQRELNRLNGKQGNAVTQLRGSPGTEDPSRYFPYFIKALATKPGRRGYYNTGELQNIDSLEDLQSYLENVATENRILVEASDSQKKTLRACRKLLDESMDINADLNRALSELLSFANKKGVAKYDSPSGTAKTLGVQDYRLASERLASGSAGNSANRHSQILVPIVLTQMRDVPPTLAYLGRLIFSLAEHSRQPPSSVSVSAEMYNYSFTTWETALNEIVMEMMDIITRLLDFAKLVSNARE